MILYVTLVVVLMAALLAAGLLFYLRAQLAGQQVSQTASQAAEAAQAGIARSVAVLLDPTRTGEDLNDNPDLFRNITVAESGDWRVSLVRPSPTGEDVPAFGLVDESGKLNLNVSTREQLLVLAPLGMTEEIADAIIAWRTPAGSTSQPADDEYYAGLDFPYRPRHGPFQSVDELLLVCGVTESLLYGEDLNRNGLLDANENDGDKLLPPDDGDGRLNPGLFAHLTVYSAARNRTVEGKPKLNINTLDADALRAELESRGFSGEMVEFLVQARRQNIEFKHPSELLGYNSSSESRSAAGSAPAANPPGSAAPSNPMRNRSRWAAPRSDGDQPPPGDSSDSDDRMQRRSRWPARRSSPQPDRDAARPADRSRQPTRQAEVASPLTVAELDKVLNELSTSDAAEPGLVNPAAASALVLRAIGFTEDEAATAVSTAARLAPADRLTPAWLVAQNVLTPERFKVLAPLLAGRGWQFRFDAVSHSSQVGLFSRIEAVIEIGDGPPRTLYQRDLTGLGPAYPSADLAGEKR